MLWKRGKKTGEKARDWDLKERNRERDKESSDRKRKREREGGIESNEERKTDWRIRVKTGHREWQRK